MVNAPKKLTDIPKEIVEHLYSEENVLFCIKKNHCPRIETQISGRN